jgi:hypothetical protein
MFFINSALEIWLAWSAWELAAGVAEVFPSAAVEVELVAGVALAGGSKCDVRVRAPLPAGWVCCAAPERDSRAKHAPAVAGAILQYVLFI